jgi:hypothetical protein
MAPIVESMSSPVFATRLAVQRVVESVISSESACKVKITIGYRSQFELVVRDTLLVLGRAPG